MIRVLDLKKSYGSRHVLTGLTFQVEPGAITLLVGANGAGKTTALRLIAGLSRPDAGTIMIAGHDLLHSRQSALAHVSFLPQAPRFHPRLTVSQTVEFYSRLRGRPAGAAALAIEAWGLPEFTRVPTGKLSGGLRQRLALAVFALADTPVLLLDEPGLSLDPLWREQLQHYIHREAVRGRTVLVATHLLGEWEGRTDRCLMIEEGRTSGELPPDRLREHFPQLRSDGAPRSRPQVCA